MAFERLGTIVDRVLQDAANRCGQPVRRDRLPTVHGLSCVRTARPNLYPANDWKKGAAHPARGGQNRMRR